jgi:hypothetical protein
MAEFGRAKEGFLRRFLKLERGIPSHDTFSRVFRLLDPEPFRACFTTFMARFAEAVQGVIAIDGKTLRHSFDAASATSALHMVSAWSCEQRLVLGQRATEAVDRHGILGSSKFCVQGGGMVFPVAGCVMRRRARGCARDRSRPGRTCRA